MGPLVTRDAAMISCVPLVQVVAATSDKRSLSIMMTNCNLNFDWLKCTLGRQMVLGF